MIQLWNLTSFIEQKNKNTTNRIPKYLVFSEKVLQIQFHNTFGW